MTDCIETLDKSEFTSALLTVALPWIAGTVISEGLLRLASQYIAPNLHFWRLFGDPAEDSVF